APSAAIAAAPPPPARVAESWPTPAPAAEVPAPSRGRRLALAAASVAMLAVLALAALSLNRAHPRGDATPPTVASAASRAAKVEDSAALPDDQPLRVPPLAPRANEPPRPTLSPRQVRPGPPPASTTSRSAGSHASLVRAVARAEGPEFSPAFASD